MEIIMKKTLILTFLSTLFLTSFAYAASTCEQKYDGKREFQEVQSVDGETSSEAPVVKEASN